MQQTFEVAFETAIEKVLLSDGYSKLASGAFDTELAIFPDEALAFFHPAHGLNRDLETRYHDNL
jgi:type I restriction enzyme, R subunit